MMTRARLILSKGLNWLAERLVPGYAVVTVYLPKTTSARLQLLCDLHNQESVLAVMSVAVTIYEKLSALESLGYDVTVEHTSGFHKMKLDVSTGEFSDVQLRLKPSSPTSN